MKKKNVIKSLLSVVIFSFVFTACSSKKYDVEYNKPAQYWYNKMLNHVSNGELDEADDTYTSLESEHRNSPLVSTSLLVLVNAHINEEEYSLANFYLDEYIKRFGLGKNIDYVRYLKIKSKFLGLKYQFRDQALIENTINEIRDFKRRYPTSAYIPLVDTINSRLLMAKASMDEEISDLYDRLDKKEAAKIYKDKSKQSWIDSKEIVDVDVPFYRAIFE